MRYGRPASSRLWHMLTPKSGKPLCWTSMVVIESRDTPPEDGDICKNCDEALRVKGKEIRKKLPRRRDSATEYVPRFRFEDD